MFKIKYLKLGHKCYNFQLLTMSGAFVYECYFQDFTLTEAAKQFKKQLNEEAKNGRFNNL